MELRMSPELTISSERKVSAYQVAVQARSVRHKVLTMRVDIVTNWSFLTIRQMDILSDCVFYIMIE